jgi:hypothetical protein
MFTNTAMSARLAGDDTGERRVFGAAGHCSARAAARRTRWPGRHPKPVRIAGVSGGRRDEDRETRGVRRADAWNRRPRGFAGRQSSHRSRRHRGQARSRLDRACRGSAVRAWKTGPRRWWNRGKQVSVPRGCHSHWHRSQCGSVAGGRGPHGRSPQRRPARGRLFPSFRALPLSVWRLCAFWSYQTTSFLTFTHLYPEIPPKWDMLARRGKRSVRRAQRADSRGNDPSGDATGRQ